MPDSMPTVPYANVQTPPPPPDDADLQEWTAYQLMWQARACLVLGSRLYSHLLEAAAEDVRRGGPAWDVLAEHATRSTDAALALRFMAAVHRLVLTRQAGELALFFPSVGGDADRAGAWHAMRQTLEEHARQLSGWVGLPCQTNEVGRCAALTAGFLNAAAETRRPLWLLEIGASAGLNLRWDRYYYEHDEEPRAWGDAASPVRLRGHWDVPRDLLEAPVHVSGRAGCDPLPVDPLTDEGRLSLSSSVWGDQPVRFERLRGALQLAQQLRVEVASARAIDWLPDQLARRPPNETTVVYHSVVLQYLSDDERRDVVTAIADAGAAADAEAPLYWLRMEPENQLRAMAVRVTRWPSGDERLLATSGAHGPPVRWRHETAEPDGTPAREY